MKCFDVPCLEGKDTELLGILKINCIIEDKYEVPVPPSFAVPG